MLTLVVHKNEKCGCFFCLTKCPQCGTSFDGFSFSASFNVTKKDDRIRMLGGIDSIAGDSLSFDPDSSLICPACETELPEAHLHKLQRALFKAIGGNIDIHRNEDGDIAIERFHIVNRPLLEEMKKKEGK